MNLNTQLFPIVRQLQHLQCLHPTTEAERRRALAESLEILRALTRYRGLLKNALEDQPARPRHHP